MRDIANEAIKRWVLPYAKAYAVAGVNLLVTFLAGFGLDVPAEVQVELRSGLTAFVVWLVPNIPYIRK